MFEFLKSDRFSYFFSFVLGLALVTLFQPVCTGPTCERHKAPSPDDMKKTTYKMGSKCYQFRAETQKCPEPPTKVIEAFETCGRVNGRRD
jgi:hypothetical protein